MNLGLFLGSLMTETWVEREGNLFKFNGGL
jgi:hypothetical protein